MLSAIYSYIFLYNSYLTSSTALDLKSVSWCIARAQASKLLHIKFSTETRGRCNFIFVIIKSHQILNHKLQHWWSSSTSHDDFHYLIALIKFLFRGLLCNGYYELSLAPYSHYTFYVHAEVATWCNPLPSVNAHIFVQPANCLAYTRCTCT